MRPIPALLLNMFRNGSIASRHYGKLPQPNQNEKACIEGNSPDIWPLFSSTSSCSLLTVALNMAKFFCQYSNTCFNSSIQAGRPDESAPRFSPPIPRRGESCHCCCCCCDDQCWSFLLWLFLLLLVTIASLPSEARPCTASDFVVSLFSFSSSIVAAETRGGRR